VCCGELLPVRTLCNALYKDSAILQQTMLEIYKEIWLLACQRWGTQKREIVK